MRNRVEKSRHEEGFSTRELEQKHVRAYSNRAMWIPERVANGTSANDTVTPYTLATLRCYVTEACASVYPALQSDKRVVCLYPT
jgi:hypothetical protein